MGNFRYRMAQFLMGRNGFDNFCRGLLFLAMILIIADIARRQAENAWYTSCVQAPFRSYMSRDRKHYKYFKCPTCKQVLRAPKGRGRIRVTCSRCHHIFEKKV